MKIYYRKKGISVSARKVGSLGMLRGLMFRSENTESLLFESSGTIHSWFVFFFFLAVFLDNKNKVVDVRIVKPFRFKVKSGKKYKKILEVPINDSNSKIVRALVGKKGLNRTEH